MLPLAGRVRQDKNFCPRKTLKMITASAVNFKSSRRDGAGTRVQQRQGDEPGAPAARSVETAATRVSRQQRRERSGGIDEDVRGDDEIC